MFGELPAWALYARHVDGLVVRNFRARSKDPTDRPAIIFEDVLDADLEGFRPESGSGQNPIVWLHEVVGAMIRGARLRDAAPLFLRVSGERSARIVLAGHGLEPARRIVETTAGAPSDAVRLAEFDRP